MFSLVVLAVYGLGGIFVPMLIIRWAGYQPDTRHSVTMMIAALVGVIVWRLLGLNEHVFESIPGMGMAFLAHFIDHAYRVEDGSPLGRYEMPSGRAIGIAALVILAPAAAAEGAYLLRHARCARCCSVVVHEAPLSSLKSDRRGIRRGRSDRPC